MPNNNTSTPPDQLDRKRTTYLVMYNVVLAVVMSFLLYQVIIDAADAEVAAQKAAKAEQTELPKPSTKPIPAADSMTNAAADTSNAEADDSAATVTTVSPAEEKVPTAPSNPKMIVYVLWAISLAGGLGGTLSNLRGIFEFGRDQSYFPSYLEMPFYLRPVSGLISGLFTFFMSSFFAGALTQGDNTGWQTLQGMFPYIGIAFVAGFAVQEFMERLKETAKTLFGVPTQAAPEPTQAVESATSTPPTGGGEELESFSTEPTPPTNQNVGKEPAAKDVPSSTIRRRAD